MWLGEPGAELTSLARLLTYWLACITHLCRQGPLKKATKFTEQLSGQINAKIMERERTRDDDVDPVGWPASEPDWSGAGAADGVGAGIGMGKPWQPDDDDIDTQLANDVPSELSIEEQVGLVSEGSFEFRRYVRGLPLPLPHDSDLLAVLFAIFAIPRVCGSW